MQVQTHKADAVMFCPRRIGHANLFVGELERSIQFYNEVCGFELVFREPHFTMGFLSNGNTHHDVALVQVTDQPLIGRGGHLQVRAGKGVNSGLNHFGWEMENERLLAEAYNRARDSNLEIARVSDHQISHSVYVHDPDGNMHEFYADVMKDWRKLFDGGSGPAITSEWDPNAAPSNTDPRYPVNHEVQRVHDALIHPVRFSHAVLMTQNHARMVEFFTNVAGLRTVHESADGEVVCFGGENSAYAFDIALFRQDPGALNTIHHYSYQVADEAEIDSAEAALADAGIEIEMRIDNDGKRSLFIDDPDGMRCEFYAARDAGLDNIGADLSPFHV